MAQLVARDVWDVDAAGSNPVTPTNPPLKKISEEGFFVMSGKSIGINTLVRF